MIQEIYGVTEPPKNSLMMASGKTITIDTVATHSDPNLVYIRVVDLSLEKVFQIFTNKTETAEMKYGSFLITGYTGFNYIQDEHNGRIRVCLREE